jgi:hypothetical protein
MIEFSAEPGLTETSPIPTAPEASPQPPARNAAVRRCVEALSRSLEESRKKRRDKYDTDEYASEAYRNQMPDLSGYENIRDFIACTTNALLFGVIDAIEASKLLYAAQVALSVLRHEPKPQKPLA